MKTLDKILVGGFILATAYIVESYMSDCITQNQMNARAQQESYQTLTVESGKCYFMEIK